jgi:hypothetical protein
MNRKRCLFIYASCLLALIYPTESSARPKCLCLTWAFVVQEPGSPARILNIGEDTVIHSGDRLRIQIVPETGGFSCYVFHLDSHGELAILFYDFEISTNILIPQEKKWYAVDKSTGIETYYFLAFYDHHLDALAKAVQAYSERPRRPEAKAAVLEEFERAQHSYSEPYVMERGVSVKAIQGKATSVSADSFYSKVIRLKHE